MDRDFWNDAYQEDAGHVEVRDVILAGELAGLPVGTALDLGCGAGTNALMLAGRGWVVTGVDWAEQAITLAIEAARARGLDARFLVGDVTAWEPRATFDLVISAYALPGGVDGERALRTAAKALAVGGTLLVVEWDVSMTEVWGFEEGDLMSPEQIAALLPGLEIEKAQVRSVQDVFAPGDPRGQSGSPVNVALVRARRPDA